MADSTSTGFLTVAGDDYAQTTDKAQLDVTGDLDLAILVEPANGWNESGAEKALAAKRINASLFERAWDFYYVNQGGGSNVLRFEWKDGGGSEHTTTSTASITSVATGAHAWLRVTLDVDDGSSQHVVTFYYSNDPIDTPIGSVSWTQLGSPVVVAGTTSIANSPHNLRVGLANVNAYGGFNGKVYGFWMRNGIGGTLVAGPDWRTSDQDWGNPPTADGVGNDWTFEGDAAWTPPTGEPEPEPEPEPETFSFLPASRSEPVRNRLGEYGLSFQVGKTVYIDSDGVAHEGEGFIDPASLNLRDGSGENGKSYFIGARSTPYQITEAEKDILVAAGIMEEPGA